MGRRLGSKRPAAPGFLAYEPSLRKRLVEPAAARCRCSGRGVCKISLTLRSLYYFTTSAASSTDLVVHARYVFYNSDCEVSLGMIRLSLAWTREQVEPPAQRNLTEKNVSTPSPLLDVNVLYRWTIRCTQYVKRMLGAVSQRLSCTEDSLTLLVDTMVVVTEQAHTVRTVSHKRS